MGSYRTEGDEPPKKPEAEPVQVDKEEEKAAATNQEEEKVAVKPSEDTLEEEKKDQVAATETSPDAKNDASEARKIETMEEESK